MRTRQIKPEFCLDEELARCVRDARLVFALLWMVADREGRLEDRPQRIKAQIFPYDDDIDGAWIAKKIDELQYHRLLFRYTVGSGHYILIRSFLKHQHCHPHEAKSQLPEPPKDIEEQAKKAGDVITCNDMSADLRLTASTYDLRLTASASTSGLSGTSSQSAAPQASPPGDVAPALGESAPKGRRKQELPKKERPKDAAYELWCLEFAEHRKISYRGHKGDWVALSDLRRNPANCNGSGIPVEWTRAIHNYFATPQASYTIADLCLRYDVFLQGPLDRFGKPIGAGGRQQDVHSANANTLQQLLMEVKHET